MPTHTPGGVLARVRAAGVRIWLDDDAKRIQGSPGKRVTEEMAKLITEHREGIMDILWHERPVGPTPCWAGGQEAVYSVFGVDMSIPIADWERLRDYNRQNVVDPVEKKLRNFQKNNQERLYNEKSMVESVEN